MEKYEGAYRPVPVATVAGEGDQFAAEASNERRFLPMSIGKSAGAIKKNFESSREEDSICGPLDPCGCCISRAQLKDGTLCNRLVMCTFAICLLWATSLQTSIYISQSTISSPKFSAVTAACEEVIDESKSQRSQYLVCVDRDLEQCADDFDEAVVQLVEQTNTRLETNADFLDEVAVYQQLCSESFTTSQAAISEWLSFGLSYVLEYTCPSDDDSPSPYCNVSCSYDDDDPNACSCVEVADMVGDISSLRSAAYETSSEYKEESRSTVSSVADYATDLAAYNEAYSYNKTEAIREAFGAVLEPLNDAYVLLLNESLDDLFPEADIAMGCLSMRDLENNTGCYEGIEGLRAVYQDVRDKLDDAIDVAQDGFEEFIDEADEFVGNVASAFNTFMTFYDGVMSLGIDYGSLPWASLSLSDFIAPDPNWPSAAGILTGLSKVPGANYIYSEVSDVFGDFVENLTLVNADVAARASALADDLANTAEDLPQLSPDDYNPPEYSEYSTTADTPEEEDELHEEESDVFIAEQAATINAFSELQNEIVDDDGIQDLNVTFNDDFEYLSSAAFTFEEFVESTFDVDFLSVNLGLIASLFLFLDYAYRIFRTLYYIRLFWSRAGVNLPPVDIRFDRDEISPFGRGNTSDADSCCDCSGGFLCIALCPCWGPCICLIFLVIILANLILIYIPILHDYRNFCVQGHGNGTFLTKNIYSLAYNYAAEDGNDAYFQGVEDYNTQKSDICGEYTTFTQEQQQEDEALLSSLVSSHELTRDDVYMMGQCINTTAMDGLFQHACCGKGGYEAYSCDPLYNLTCPRNYEDVPYEQLGTLLDNAGCTEDPSTWTIDDASFYCSDLPDCQPSCDNPNKEVLRHLSNICGCMAEWLLHAWWMQTCGVIMVYILMNLSRIIVVDALCRIFWRTMAPNCFTYLATCSFDGQYLGPPDGHKFPSFKRMLHDELHELLRFYGRSAWVELLLGIAINYIWVYFLNWVQDSIRYDANAI
uniref:Uncharacterized protein n=1 Tax=Rhizochromulina marina TaxID=1034831 RepID=A0A7S2RBE8_9STRA|mmetsp:Transcript_13265/g.38609  ORF Transcript_13265/g.38609 Transcript_13265/m.38609 type:complete len:993 (+) Transcript_13265:83-3061(+)